MKPIIPPFLAFSIVLVPLGMTQLASAALLVNETYDNYAPFDFAITGGPLTGPATNATGLTGSYIVNNPGGGSGYSFATGGLAFADYNTAGGGKLVYRSNTGGTTIQAQVSISSSVTGTLYSSYLVNIDAPGTTSGGFTEVRVTTNSGEGGAFARFRSQPDSSVANQNGPGASYSDTTGAAGVATALTVDTTYMVISRFINVGQSLSASTPGTASTFVLDANQYLAFKATGFSESYLDSGAVTARISSTPLEAGGPLRFENSNFIQVGGINAASGITYIDALKYGTDLTSVVTIPEPTSAALILFGSAFGVARRRRTK